MAVRFCKCDCGEELPPGASKQMLYKPGHRQRRYQRRKDARVREALRAVGGRESVKTTARAAGSGRKRKEKRSSPVRYALVRRAESTLEILGFATATSKRAVERAFGISAHPDLKAIAERQLPEVV
jgi:hypothetical protein